MPAHIIVEETGGDQPEFDDNGAIVRINHADGSITISLDGKPIDEPRSKKNGKWFGNLVEDLDDAERGRIANELLRGVEDDLQSREGWVEDRAQGIKLMGFKVELPGQSTATDGAPVDGQSRVRHPLLQESVLRFQANARSELLPTDGPVKIRVDATDGDTNEDSLASHLEMDLNHYLTSVATEYYPDTDRMLLMLGFGGTAFKKVYYDAVKQRPVSVSVDADDLIVNNSATDLASAARVTHRSYLRRSFIRRMQIVGEYLDVPLHDPKERDLDAAQREKKEQEGVRLSGSRPDDRDREIYEIYCELDLKGHEHKINGKETGLEVPYRVTIDVSSEKILSIVRDYDEDTKDLPEKRTTFVKYPFVPGFGFYDIGLIHILGNTTNALTAAWREMLDAGMFNCFPGFLISKAGTRQETNVFRIPPGGGQTIDTQGMAIKDAVMPMPYQPPSQALMALTEEMTNTGQRVGGTAELQVGEGKQDAPVGTTITLVEQATKVMNSVHKRLHAAQAEEFRLLARCFREHPEAFLRMKKNPSKRKWEEKEFIQAINDLDLEPQADPNTASFGQRVLKAFGLLQLATAFPMLYNLVEINKMIVETVLHFGNPEQYMAPASAMGRPTPDQMNEKTKADADMLKAKAAMIKAGQPEQAGLGAGQQITPAEEQAKLMDAKTKAMKVAVDHQNNVLDAQDKAAQLRQDSEDNRAALELEHRKHLDTMQLEKMKLHAQSQQEAFRMQHEQQQAHAEIGMQREQHQQQMQQEQMHSEQEMQMRQQERQDSREDAAIERKDAKAEAAAGRKHEEKQVKVQATAKAKAKAQKPARSAE